MSCNSINWNALLPWRSPIVDCIEIPSTGVITPDMTEKLRGKPADWIIPDDAGPVFYGIDYSSEYIEERNQRIWQAVIDIARGG
jgi:hypothetical protein